MLTESDFAYVSAAELARRVREQELTSVELIDICIDRIEKRNEPSRLLCRLHTGCVSGGDAVI